MAGKSAVELAVMLLCACGFGGVLQADEPRATGPSSADESFVASPAFEAPSGIELPSPTSLTAEELDVLLKAASEPSFVFALEPPRRSTRSAAIVKGWRDPQPVAERVKPNPFRVPRLHRGATAPPWDDEPADVQPPPKPKVDRST